jgi:uncharacterized protein (TIGR02246 family)
MGTRASTGRPPEQAVAATRAAFSAALEDGDACAAAAVYAVDARLLPPSAPPLRGRAAIEAFWRAGIESGLDGVELEAVELERRDGLAYEIGRYALHVGAVDSGEVVDRGAYVLVHERQQDGSWLRTFETFNSDAVTVAEGSGQS